MTTVRLIDEKSLQERIQYVGIGRTSSNTTDLAKYERGDYPCVTKANAFLTSCLLCCVNIDARRTLVLHSVIVQLIKHIRGRYNRQLTQTITFDQDPILFSEPIDLTHII